MHPQIRQEGPGNCPICGMALEPLVVTAEATPNHELADMTRRFWIGLVLTLPVFVLEMASHIPGLHVSEFVPPQISTWIQFVLATPVVLWAGWPFFQRGWASLMNRSLNMFSLIALGTGAAYLYSVVATLVPALFPAGFRGRYHGARAPRPSARVARARANRRRNSCAAEFGTKKRATDFGTWRR